MPIREAAFDWLKVQTDVSHGDISSIGYCMGGRISFLANSALPLKRAVSYYGGNIAPALLDRASMLHGPMLFFWGGLDKHIPPEQREQVIDALKQNGKKYVNVEISDADHAFFCDARPAYNARASQLAWALDAGVSEVTPASSVYVRGVTRATVAPVERMMSITRTTSENGNAPSALS